MEIDAPAVVQVALVKKVKPAAGAASSPTAVAAETLAGLPEASCVCRVSTGEHVPALGAREGVVKASWVGAPEVIVCPWLAGVSPEAVAVTVSAPAELARKESPTLWVPAARVTEAAA